MQDRVYFSFADPVGFSGQRAATELVIQGLTIRGWECHRLTLPVLKDSGRRMSRARFMMSIFASWMRALRLTWARRGTLCVNIGQTRFALFRDAVPLLLGRLGLGRERIFVSLHSGLFTHWARDSFEARAFRSILGHAGTITVLGNGQRDRLVELGLDETRIAVVVNSCDAPVATAKAIAEKHEPKDGNGAVKLLYLSSLIDTKGYPEFLEAVRRLSVWSGPEIDAVICGNFAPSEFAETIKTSDQAEAEIGRRLEQINRSGRTRARWVRGAAGDEKAKLFREAHVFVLPTRYAVEAQPLVLFEAMASGCAILTSCAGEIPAILDSSCAVMLKTPTADTVEEALQSLTIGPARRARLAAAARERFVSQFSVERHIDRWEGLLRKGRVEGIPAE